MAIRHNVRGHAQWETVREAVKRLRIFPTQGAEIFWTIFSHQRIIAIMIWYGAARQPDSHSTSMALISEWGTSCPATLGLPVSVLFHLL